MQMRGIGRVARDSGLSVSALRFYDTAGVLRPAWSDPRTGYRWYRPEQVRDARLVAALRRVGMPVAEIRQVLAVRHDPAAADRILQAHLRRLENGLTDARRLLSTARSLLPMEPAMTTTRLTVPAPALAAALAAVRFAASADPDLPMLTGVLLDADGDSLRTVATDRYRLAVSTAPATRVSGPPIRVIAPLTLVDRALAVLTGATAVTLELRPDQITLTTADQVLEAAAVQHEFPDWQRLLRLTATRHAHLDVAVLRTQLAATPTLTLRREQDGADYDVAVLDIGPDGDLRVGADTTATGVGVNREFLLQALDAADTTELVLDLDGPVAPLAIRNPDRADTFSILMPTRLT